jgi:hypothetical protein
MHTGDTQATHISNVNTHIAVCDTLQVQFVGSHSTCQPQGHHVVHSGEMLHLSQRLHH